MAILSPSGTSAGSLSSAGSSDLFVMKLDPAGALGWAGRVGSTGSDGGLEIAHDGADTLYLTGYYQGSVDFDPGSGTSSLSGAAGTDAFALKLGTDGSFGWAAGMGGPEYDYGFDLAVNGQGDVFVAGRFAGTADFDPGPGTANRTSAGSWDAFVTKLSQGSPNRAPSAADDAYAVDEETMLEIAAPGVLDNDSDPDGNSLTAILVSQPANGIVRMQADGSFVYFPDLNFAGTDTFTYTVNDGQTDGNVATVTVTVNPINDAPYVDSPVVTTDEDTPVDDQIASIDVEGDPYEFALETAPINGTAVINPDGTFTYTPDADFHGTDSFTFRATDDQDASRIGTVTIEVLPVNDAPVARDDAYSVDEDGTLTITAASVFRFAMQSEPGDWIGQGGSYAYTDATADFGANVNFDNGVSLSVLQDNFDGDWWYLDFAAPFEAALTPGLYEGAMRFRFQDSGRPGLDVSGNGRGHNRLAGEFVVYDVAYGPAESVERFAASFVQWGLNSDNSLDPPLTGTIQYNTAVGTGAGVLANDEDVDGDLFTAILVSGPSNGTLSLNADGTLSYTPDPDFTGTDSFTYKTNDGYADSGVATVTITVDPVNDAPIATDDAYGTDEDTPLVIAAPGVLANDTDIDGDALAVSLVANPANGSVTLNSDGSFTYTPGIGFAGVDSFTYKVNDGSSDSDEATVTITVDAVNDPPTASDGSIATDEEATVSGALSASDPEGDELTFVVVSGPSSGSLQYNRTTGAYTYTPDTDFAGTDSFLFYASDGRASSNTAAVTITVNPVNDAPVNILRSTQATTAEDSALQLGGDVSVNDPDSGLEPIRTVLSIPAGTGTLSVVPFDGATVTGNGTGRLEIVARVGLINETLASLAYTPAADLNASIFGGPVVLTIVTDDQGNTGSGGALTDTDTLAITVDPVNDAPVFAIAGDVVGTAEDAGAQAIAGFATGIAAGPATATDEAGQSLRFVVTVESVTGDLAFVDAPTIAPDGTLTFTTAPDTNGTATLTATLVDDGSGASPNVNTSASQSFSIRVGAVNDAPTLDAIGDTTIDEDAPTQVINLTGITAGPANEEGQTLTVSATSSNPGLIPDPAVVYSSPDLAGTLSFTPVADAHGTATITVTVRDVGGTNFGGIDVVVRTFTVTVSPVNDDPTALDDRAETPEDVPVTVAVLSNDTDIEGNSLSVSGVTQPAHGAAAINPDGSVTYTPDPDYNGIDSFTYTIADSNGGTSTATVTVTVAPVNDTPTAVADSYNTAEDRPLTVPSPGVLGNDRDLDGDRLTAALVSGPTNGTLTLNADGSFTYTPAADFNGTDSFTYGINDGSVDGNTAVVTIVVDPVNDPPTADDLAIFTDEDRVSSGVVTAGDFEGDALTYAVVDGPSHGTLQFDAATGTFTYTPAADYNGPDSFTFKANDGLADSDIATVSIVVDPVNDPPTAAAATFTIPENSADGTVVGSVEGADVDGDALSYIIVSGNEDGAFAIDAASGRITVADGTELDYETTPQFSFVVRVTDPEGQSAEAPVTINLTDVDESSPAVAIDILPSRPDNQINFRSKGKLEVAILSTATFDALSVDVDSLTFGRTGDEDSLSRSPRGGPRYRIVDLDGDGRLDLVVQFEVKLTGFQSGDLIGTLKGRTRAGASFFGTDAVSIKSPGK